MSREAGEVARLERLRRLARLLDTAFTIPIINFRVGLDALVGLIPGFGDLLTLLPSSYLILEGARLGVPRRTLLLMVYNLGLEALVGAIPLVGDIFDAVWKANVRNLHLLEKHLDPERASPAPSGRGLAVFLVVALLLLAGLGFGAVYLLRALVQALSALA